MLIATGTFFVLVVNTVSGIRGVDKKLVELGNVYDKRSMHMLSEILLPSALPSIMIGLRIGLSLAWILLIAAELIAAQSGLGWFIWDARNFSRPDDMIVGMFAVGFFGMLTDKLLVKIGDHALRWQVRFEGR